MEILPFMEVSIVSFQPKGLKSPKESYPKELGHLCKGDYQSCHEKNNDHIVRKNNVRPKLVKQGSPDM